MNAFSFSYKDHSTIVELLGEWTGHQNVEGAEGPADSLKGEGADMVLPVKFHPHPAAAGGHGNRSEYLPLPFERELCFCSPFSGQPFYVVSWISIMAI